MNARVPFEAIQDDRLRPVRLPAHRQSHRHARPHLPHRHAGARAARPDAARTRSRREPEHRRLRQRLSRLAARHGRPAVVEGEKTARVARRALSARDQRGTRRHRRARHAAGGVGRGTHRRMASSRCGTARARASIARAMRSSTATRTVRRRTAACWSWRATITAACRRRCRIRAIRR